MSASFDSNTSVVIFRKGQPQAPLTLIPNQWLFPGGEVGIKFTPDQMGALSRCLFDDLDHILIVSRIANSNDFMAMIQVNNVVRMAVHARGTIVPVALVLPYLPYGRQDRMCCVGEAFSLRAFGESINSMNFFSVKTFDAHSSVASGVINNLQDVSQLKIVQSSEMLKARINGPYADKHVIFVSPDAGANKKTSELAKYFGHPRFIRADKLRNLATGEIKETIVYAEEGELEGATVIIADDICDGGRTFIELAKVLKAKKAAKVVLFVTHGIFSKGLEPLYKEGIDEIWTTDTYSNSWLGYLPDAPQFLVDHVIDQ